MRLTDIQKVAALTATFIISSGASGCSHVEQGPLFHQDHLAGISTFYNTQLEDGRLPGASILIAHRGEIVFEEQIGYADLENSTALTADSLFRIYSMTKPVVAAAALQLVEEGTIDLDDPVADYLPELETLTVLGEAGVGPAQSVMTVRDLLTHEAGWSASWSDTAQGALLREAGVYETNPYTLADKSKLPNNLDEFVARIATVPLAHEPGARMTYGLSSDVLGAVIERVSGKTLATYLAEHIFQPLGMMDTGFCVEPDRVSRLTNLYAYSEAAELYLADAAMTSVRRCPVGVFSGGSGLISTPRDYLKFAEALRTGGGLILSPDMAALFQAKQDVDESSIGWWMGGTDWGLSVAQVVDPSATDWKDVAGNFYWSGGASTYFWIDPKNEMTAMMFTQVERNGQPNHFKSDFRNLVYNAFVGAAHPGR